MPEPSRLLDGDWIIRIEALCCFRPPPALSQIVIEALRITNMSYVTRPLRPLGRSLDIAAVAGFAMACAGTGALAIEVKVRGWWGFATSTADLIAVFGCLVLSTLLSVWAFERADGWWRALALAGVVVSMLAVASLAILAGLRLLIEFPGALSDDSNRRRGRRRSNRRRRRSSW